MYKEAIRCINCNNLLFTSSMNPEGTFLFCQCKFITPLQYSRIERVKIEDNINTPEYKSL